MTSPNPLLADTDLPDFAAIKAAHVVPAIEEAIEQHRAAIAQITEGQADDFGSVILAAERADFLLSRTWSPVGHPRVAGGPCVGAGADDQLPDGSGAEPRAS